MINSEVKPSLRPRGVAVAVLMATLVLPAASALATPVPVLQPQGGVCVIVGADNVPSSGDHLREDTCHLQLPFTGPPIG
jgi:hypothetical protein